MTEQMTELKPCLFCGSLDEMVIKENTTHPVMNKPANVISCDITHWCKVDGLPRRRIHVTGRDRAEAITAWNNRAASVPSDKERDGPIGYATLGDAETATDLITIKELAGYSPEDYFGHRRFIPLYTEAAPDQSEDDKFIRTLIDVVQTDWGRGFSGKPEQDAYIAKAKDVLAGKIALVNNADEAPERTHRRIQDLLETNNRYLQRARDAEETIKALVEKMTSAKKMAHLAAKWKKDHGSDEAVVRRLGIIEQELTEALALAEKGGV